METPDIEKTEPDETANAKRMWGGRVWVPILLVLTGIGLLLRQMNLGMPDWIFSWPMILIVVGIFSGLSHGFRGPGWLIMILVGTFFLLDQLIPGMDFHRYLWPAVIILVGLVMLIRPNKPSWMHDQWDANCSGRKIRDQERWRRRMERRGYPRMNPDNPADPAAGTTGLPESGNARTYNYAGMNSKNFTSEDYIDSTTVLGGLHKYIVSKNFKGGDITIFMGGAEINLSQADIQGTARLDITQIMGGTKIIVPPHWEIRSQVTSVFGNIEDKRQSMANTDHSKVLIIDGSSVFGGIEIRNY